jgi:hypothetical protein
LKIRRERLIDFQKFDILGPRKKFKHLFLFDFNFVLKFSKNKPISYMSPANGDSNLDKFKQKMKTHNYPSKEPFDENNLHPRITVILDPSRLRPNTHNN